jgi:hypothetical protein
MSRLVTLIIVVMVGLTPLLAAADALGAPNPKRRHAPIEIETGLLRTAAARGLTARDRGGRPSVQDRYIVVPKDNAGDPLRVAERLSTDGVVPTHVYRHVFKGFAAMIPPGQLAKLRRDPNVVSVTPTRSPLAAQTVPTGVDRIDADLSSVAKIDGVDAPRSTSTSRSSTPASAPTRTSTSGPPPFATAGTSWMAT